MAVTSTPIASDLAITFDLAGKGVTRRFADVKLSATDADIYDVAAGAAGIVSVQDLTVMMVERRTTNELENA